MEPVVHKRAAEGDGLGCGGIIRALAAQLRLRISAQRRSNPGRPAVTLSIMVFGSLLCAANPQAQAQLFDGRGAPRALLRPALPPPPPAGDAWVSVSVGSTGTASFMIGDPEQLNEVVLGLPGEEEPRLRFLEKRAQEPSLRFSVGVHHRFESVDLGGVITHQAGQPALFDAVERRLPGYAQGLIHLRWRAFERHWGAFYGGVGVGGLISQPSHGFRASVAFQFEGKPDLTLTDERLVAFSASSRFGAMMYHGDDVGFFVEYVGTGYVAEYRVADHHAVVSGTNECLQAGVTWSL